MHVDFLTWWVVNALLLNVACILLQFSRTCRATSTKKSGHVLEPSQA